MLRTLTMHFPERNILSHFSDWSQDEATCSSKKEKLKCSSAGAGQWLKTRAFTKSWPCLRQWAKSCWFQCRTDFTLEAKPSIHIPPSVKNPNSLNWGYPQCKKKTPFVSNIIAFIFKSIATAPENGSRGLLNVKQVTLFCLSPMFPPVYFKGELFNPRT